LFGRLSRYFDQLSLAKLAGYSRPIAWLLRLLRIIFYIFDEFVKDNCLQTAASLAYTTLLSLVPLAAISLAILSRFKFSQETIERLLMKHLLPSASFQGIILENIQKFAANTAALSILGTLFLAFTAVALLNTVEGSFNAIWKVKEKRNLLSKFTSFWSIITFSPILLGASVFLTSRFYEVRIVGSLLKHGLIRSGIHYVLPFFLIFLIVFLAYRLLPNTKVRVFPALIGAVITTALFSLARWWFGVYLTKYAHFDKIYGMLGTLPAFLIWIYISWVIALYGSEVAYTFQYHRLNREEQRLAPGDPAYHPYYGVRLVLILASRFQEGDGPVSVASLADLLGMPHGSVQELLSGLEKGRIVAALGEEKEMFLLARDPGRLSLKEIVEAVQGGSLGVASLPDDRSREVIRGIFERAQGAMDEVLRQVTIEDVAERLDQDRGVLPFA